MKEFNVPREQFEPIAHNSEHDIDIRTDSPPEAREVIRLRETVQSETGEEYTGAWINVYVLSILAFTLEKEGKFYNVVFSTSEPSKKNQ